MSDAVDLQIALDTYADLDPPCICWLGGDKAEAGISYCRSCAEKAVADGKGEFVDSCGGPPECDGCEHCETCGCLLDYTLTDYGAESELGHFKSVRFRKPISRDDAYHVARMIAALPNDKDAIRVAERAVAAIPTPESHGPR